VFSTRILDLVCVQFLSQKLQGNIKITIILCKNGQVIKPDVIASRNPDINMSTKFNSLAQQKTVADELRETPKKTAITTS